MRHQTRLHTEVHARLLRGADAFQGGHVHDCILEQGRAGRIPTDSHTSVIRDLFHRVVTPCEE